MSTSAGTLVSLKLVISTDRSQEWSVLELDALTCLTALTKLSIDGTHRQVPPEFTNTPKLSCLPNLQLLNLGGVQMPTCFVAGMLQLRELTLNCGDYFGSSVGDSVWLRGLGALPALQQLTIHSYRYGCHRGFRKDGWRGLPSLQHLHMPSINSHRLTLLSPLKRLTSLHAKLHDCLHQHARVSHALRRFTALQSLHLTGV